MLSRKRKVHDDDVWFAGKTIFIYLFIYFLSETDMMVIYLVLLISVLKA